MSDTETVETVETNETVIDEPEVVEDLGEAQGKPAPYLEINTGKDSEPYRLTGEEATKWYNDYHINNTKWKDKNRKESEELNQLRADFEAEKNEWEQLRDAESEFYGSRNDSFKSWVSNEELEINKQKWDLIQKANELDKYRDKLQGLDKKQQEARRSERERGQGYLAIAAAKLTRDYPDFNVDEVFNFHKEHFQQDWSDQSKLGQLTTDDFYNEIRYHYWAMLGSKMEDKLAEARADVVRRSKDKKGLPRSGMKSADNIDPYKNETIDERRRRLRK